MDRSTGHDGRAADPLIGRQLGDFRVRRRLAEGGVGTIYLAEQAAPGRAARLGLARLSSLEGENLWARRQLARAAKLTRDRTDTLLLELHEVVVGYRAGRVAGDWRRWPEAAAAARVARPALFPAEAVATATAG